MIVGVVMEDEARVKVRVCGADGQEQEITAIIDTGYTGWLTLPPSLIATLMLPWQSVVRGALANGSESLFDVFAASVSWDGQTRHIAVDEAETDPLLGRALLNGYQLKVEVRRGGEVLIRRME